MTDLRDINSTSHTSKNEDGKTVHTVRDSLIAEILLSLIIGLTIISITTLVRCYIELFQVSMYAHYSLLVVAVLHTIARRLRINSVPAILVLQIMVSLAFFLVAIQIPILEFGNSTANKVYLVIILVAFTLFSFFYRLKPAFMAGDIEFMAFPAAFHVIGYILFSLIDRSVYAVNLLVNAIVIAIIFIIMRQIAVFDTKYYHSIHKLSKPSSHLKKQNNKTIIGLIVIITIALCLLTVFPYELVLGLLKKVFVAILGFIVKLLLSSPVEPEIAVSDPTKGMEMLDGSMLEDPLFEIIARILYFIIAVVLIANVINGLRIILKYAPKLSKGEEVTSDENLTDTIEDIKPEKKTSLFTRSRDFGSGHERRIRKQFYDKTRRAMKKGLPVGNTSTPGQIEEVLLENGDKDISALRKEYEKVRYGK